MESELTHAQGHHYEKSDLSGHTAGLPSGGEGNSEVHQEKPSMMKRVRAKAKKIKNRLTGHGNDQSRGQDEIEEDEDEDEELVEEHGIHGAPTSEVVADKSASRSFDGQSTTPGDKLDSPHYNSSIVDPETRPFVQWQADEDQGKNLLNEDKHVTLPSKLVDTRSAEDINPELPHKSVDTRTVRDVYEERENADQVGGPNAMDVDPQGPDLRAHPSDAQIKTIDPASRGSEQEAAVGITPVIKSFNGLGIEEEKPKPEQGEEGGLYTGSHNQFSSESVPSDSSHSVSKSYDAANPQDMPSFESSHLVSKSYDAAKPRDMPSFESSDSVSKSYDAAKPRDIPSFESSDSKSYDAANPRDVPSFESSDSVSKNYNAANPRDMPTSESFDSVPKSHNAANHQDMTSSESSESVPKSYNAGDPQDIPEDVYDPTSQSSTYTEKITSAIAGTALSAKNAISSKIGQTPKSGEVSERRSVMDTETDTLPPPVYEKVIGVGAGATSKESELGAETTQESSESLGQDKDVSMKEYSEEKLKPDEEYKPLSEIMIESLDKSEEVPSGGGEEYKPLSSVMIESLDKSHEENMEEVPSGGGEGHGVSQLVSDAVDKREPEESEEQKPVGKVTESEEVAKQLGSEEEGSGVGNAGAGASMVSKLTGAIGSWLGGSQAQTTPVTTLADDNEGDLGKNADAQVVPGEKKLQE